MTQVQTSIVVATVLDKTVKHSKRFAGLVRAGSANVEFAPYIPNEILAALGIQAGDGVTFTITKTEA